MKILTYICIALFTVTATAQSPYELGMNKAFDLWKDNNIVEAANLFERIATAEKENWIPVYYVSQINVLKSFGEKDPTVLKAQMDKALDFLNQVKTLAGVENPYVKVLEAQYYTAWIASDGMKYGMKYAGKVGTLYNEALALAPENPIVVMGKAEWDAGSAKYFGKSMEPYCKDVQKALDLSVDYTPEGLFYPKFQKERAINFLENNCK
ncbi:hypothetical protein SCB49_13960 [unidentified eubacterium SCB49]|nr:hypothetical protein SCB49_13960 [unidentified eubacterium SCB49]